MWPVLLMWLKNANLKKYDHFISSFSGSDWTAFCVVLYNRNKTDHKSHSIYKVLHECCILFTAFIFVTNQSRLVPEAHAWMRERTGSPSCLVQVMELEKMLWLEPCWGYGKGETRLTSSRQLLITSSNIKMGRGQTFSSMLKAQICFFNVCC